MVENEFLPLEVLKSHDSPLNDIPLSKLNLKPIQTLNEDASIADAQKIFISG